MFFVFFFRSLNIEIRVDIVFLNKIQILIKLMFLKNVVVCVFIIIFLDLIMYKRGIQFKLNEIVFQFRFCLKIILVNLVYLFRFIQFQKIYRFGFNCN